MAKNIAYVPISQYKEIKQGGIIENPKFMPSYYEYIKIKGTKIKISNSTSTSGLFYTVPDGYTLFITNSCVSAVSLAAVGLVFNSYLAVLEGQNNSYTIANIINGVCVGSVVGNSNNSSLNFEFPYQINGNSRIYLETNANCQTLAILVGFLVKSADLSI